ncbi:MAG TPA: hypothetical protein [Caudoviricetes sp.]|nr:MAG TPA: hypothetical protein [Caudoviricetes sp.]
MARRLVIPFRFSSSKILLYLFCYLYSKILDEVNLLFLML